MALEKSKVQNQQKKPPLNHSFKEEKGNGR